MQDLIEKALSSFERQPEGCLSIAAHLKKQDFAEWADCLTGIAELKQSPALAKTLLERAYDYAEREQDSLLFAIASAYLGRAFHMQGEYKQGGRYCHEALPLCEHYAMFEPLAQCYKNLGAYYYVMGLYEQSLSYWRACVKLYREKRPQHMYKALGNLGLVELDLERYSHAERLFKEAIEGSKRANDEENILRFLANLLYLYNQKGEAEKTLALAEDFLERASDAYPEIYIYLYNHVGDAHTQLNQFDEGLENYQQSLGFLNDHPNPYLESQLLFDIGLNYCRQSWWELALLHFQKALKMAMSLEDKTLQFKTHEQLAKVFEAQQNTALAFEHFKQFHSLQLEVLEHKHSVRLNNLLLAHDLRSMKQSSSFK